MIGDKQCSHIINIFQKTQNPPPQNKGNLFLSGVITLKKPQKIKKLNITCVVTIIDDYTYKSVNITTKLEQMEIKDHKWIMLEDDQDMSIFPHLDEAHEYIKSKLQDHNVLVHCAAGISRSSSLVIAFLMKQYGMDYHNAHLFTKSKRKIIQPNSGFQNDLKKFEEYLKEHHPQIFEKKQE